ncbi:MAG: ADP-ribosylglycohydrolase family protein [Sulfuritalea sp.]|nr:ADP-ribosylglycohydrolase family protein [Sulfuritalea sp.]
METVERFRGALLGLACGDAVGTTVEFKARGSFAPVSDMVGGGPFRLKPGEWTDDTSMALCLATSMVECGRFDAADQMQRYCRWMESGYLASNGRCFDIGRTVSQALHAFRKTSEPYSGSTDPNSAGNGCLMRLAPVPMFFFPDREAAIAMSGESSRTTHGAQECIEASRLFGAMLVAAFSGCSKDEILFCHGVGIVGSERLRLVAAGSSRHSTEADIQGSGYVVESLEASLWCFLNADSFHAAVLLPTNLGRDADTTAAICGQLAGAFYGESGIPHEWRERLVMAGEIRALAEILYRRIPD